MTGMRAIIRENGNTVMGSFAFDDPALSRNDQEPVAQSSPRQSARIHYEIGAPMIDLKKKIDLSILVEHLAQPPRVKT